MLISPQLSLGPARSLHLRESAFKKVTKNIKNINNFRCRFCNGNRIEWSQKSSSGPHRRDVTHILSKVSCFYWNPFIFVGYGNDRFFPIQILIFRMLRNNADARRRSYIELGLPVLLHILLMFLTYPVICYPFGCIIFPIISSYIIYSHCDILYFQLFKNRWKFYNYLLWQ